MNRIKKIVFAALAAAALTGAAGAAHLDRPVQGSSSVSAGIRSSSAASEVVRLTNSGARTRDRAQLFAYTPVGCVIQFGAQRERCDLSPGGGEHRLRPEKRIRGRECVDEFAGPPREHSEQQLLAHRLCERQYRRHALLGAAFRGLTGADRYSLPAWMRDRADGERLCCLSAPAYFGYGYRRKMRLTLYCEPHFCCCVSFVLKTAGITGFSPLPRLAPARIYRLSYLLK